jgi:hypothetical protein
MQIVMTLHRPVPYPEVFYFLCAGLCQAKMLSLYSICLLDNGG